MDFIDKSSVNTADFLAMWNPVENVVCGLYTDGRIILMGDSEDEVTMPSLEDPSRSACRSLFGLALIVRMAPLSLTPGFRSWLSERLGTRRAPQHSGTLLPKGCVPTGGLVCPWPYLRTIISHDMLLALGAAGCRKEKLLCSFARGGWAWADSMTSESTAKGADECEINQCAVSFAADSVDISRQRCMRALHGRAPHVSPGCRATVVSFEFGH